MWRFDLRHSSVWQSRSLTHQVDARWLYHCIFQERHSDEYAHPSIFMRQLCDHLLPKAHGRWAIHWTHSRYAALRRSITTTASGWPLLAGENR